MPLVKISDEGATDAFGVEQIPSLVYFENGVPELYPGDLLNDDAILKWMLSELKQEEIKVGKLTKLQFHEKNFFLLCI